MKQNRPNSPDMEAILGARTDVLDHGFIRVVDYMGDDAAVVQAARVSYGEGTKTPSDDRTLIRYLMRHRHTTPFEMCEIKLHVKLPIFVARQWVRHRTASINEYSARYSVLKNEFYVPDQDVIMPQSESNRQGREGGYAPHDRSILQSVLRNALDSSMKDYEDIVDSPYGISRELARIVVPVSAYTEWYWKIDLHNLFHFLSLRADPHAQWEIRQYATVILNIVARWVPMSYEAFVDYVQYAETMSRMEMKAIQSIVGRLSVEEGADWLKEYGMSDREVREFIKKIRPYGGGTS